MKDEKAFCDEVVIPYLIEKGHEILRRNQTSGFIREKSGATLNPIVDISSVFQGVIYISEVKIKADLDHIQKAIGQLITHRFIHRTVKRNGIKYQMIFPSRSQGTHMFLPSFLEYLSKLDIDVLFL